MGKFWPSHLDFTSMKTRESDYGEHFIFWMLHLEYNAHEKVTGIK